MARLGKCTRNWLQLDHLEEIIEFQIRSYGTSRQHPHALGRQPLVLYYIHGTTVYGYLLHYELHPLNPSRWRRHRRQR